MDARRNGCVKNMPYIKKERHENLDDAINKLIALLKSSTDSGQHDSGDVVYALYRIVVAVFGFGNFEIRSNAMKCLDSAFEEYVENIMKPYEKKKKEENGDIPELSGG
jgi:hypothetical protein